MKIYEAMAARLPAVSTTVGAEGLEVHPPEDILIADSPSDLAAACLQLLGDPGRRASQAKAAWNLVATKFGWDSIARQFESILEKFRL